ncbi:MAG: porin family protein [Bacteroidota bacterium]|nr:porin family protein [Bacteroidota bacterium]
MKTKILSVVILLLITSSLFAQKFSLGIKGGANLGKMSGQSFKDQFTLGYQVGAFATIGFGKFGIQPEVLFNQVNVDTASNFSQVYQLNHVDKISLKGLTIPILLNYNLNKFITLQAGPQFGILIDNNKDFLQNGRDAFKSGDFSLVGGIQLNILRFRIYGRFVGGLTDLNNIQSSETWKAQTIQLGVGIKL